MPTDPTAPIAAPDFDAVLAAVGRERFAMPAPRQSHVVNSLVQGQAINSLLMTATSLDRIDPSAHQDYVDMLAGQWRELLLPVAAVARFLGETARAHGVNVPPEIAGFERGLDEMRGPAARPDVPPPAAPDEIAPPRMGGKK